MTKGDKFLIVFILVCAALIFAGFKSYGFGGGKTYAIIEVNGKQYQKISLGQDGPKLQVKVPGVLGESVVEVDKDKVRMVYSPCPDKDCERQGWVKSPGQMLVCLPNRVTVKIESENSQRELDGVSF